MKTAEGFVQGYNAQAAVDAASQIIVAHRVTAAANDQQQLVPMVVQIKQHMGRQAREVSADAGYGSEANLWELSRRHIHGYVATGRQPHGQASAGGRRHAKGGTRTRAMQIKLRRGGYRSRYRLRKQTVEPVFGQIKQARGFRQVLLRGIEKVTQEWSLVCLAHNLLKLAKAIAWYGHGPGTMPHGEASTRSRALWVSPSPLTRPSDHLLRKRLQWLVGRLLGQAPRVRPPR